MNRRGFVTALLAAPVASAFTLPGMPAHAVEPGMAAEEDVIEGFLSFWATDPNGGRGEFLPAIRLTRLGDLYAVHLGSGERFLVATGAERLRPGELFVRLMKIVQGWRDRWPEDYLPIGAD